MAKNIIQAQQRKIAEMSRIGEQLKEESAESLVTPTPYHWKNSICPKQAILPVLLQANWRW